jgi:hypothetical protein
MTPDQQQMMIANNAMNNNGQHLGNGVLAMDDGTGQTTIIPRVLTR